MCKSCHNFLSKNKMPMQVQVNNMELCSKFSELDRLYPIELVGVNFSNHTIYVFCCNNEGARQTWRIMFFGANRLEKNPNHFAKVMWWRILDFSFFKTSIDWQEFGSNLYVLYVSTSLKKNRSRVLRSLSILEKMYPDFLKGRRLGGELRECGLFIVKTKKRHVWESFSLWVMNQKGLKQ